MQRYGLIVADNGSDMYGHRDDGRAVEQQRPQPGVPRPDRRRLRSGAARLERQSASLRTNRSADHQVARVRSDRGAADARRRMVAEQIRARGVRDRRVLEALARVPREVFLPDDLRHEALPRTIPCPIGHGQTISQPYIVGYMTEALRLEPSHRVLEIGTGCGYQTAVLAELAARSVFDRVDCRARRSRARHAAGLGYRNVTSARATAITAGPSTRRSIGSSSPPPPPAVPPALVDQLADGGHPRHARRRCDQELRVLQKRGDRRRNRWPPSLCGSCRWCGALAPFAALRVKSSVTVDGRVISVELMRRLLSGRVGRSSCSRPLRETAPTPARSACRASQTIVEEPRPSSAASHRGRRRRGRRHAADHAPQKMRADDPDQDQVAVFDDLQPIDQNLGGFLARLVGGERREVVHARRTTARPSRIRATSSGSLIHQTNGLKNAVLRREIWYR